MENNLFTEELKDPYRKVLGELVVFLRDTFASSRLPSGLSSLEELLESGLTLEDFCFRSTALLFELELEISSLEAPQRDLYLLHEKLDDAAALRPLGKPGFFLVQDILMRFIESASPPERGQLLSLAEARDLVFYQGASLASLDEFAQTLQNLTSAGISGHSSELLLIRLTNYLELKKGQAISL